ncbi:hypothetical protein EIP86_006469 [Pleurotus ostreatoroseus]|nr:hypothetical protein EIP86_006469 [Pleurotus ostreatoroseus]
MVLALTQPDHRTGDRSSRPTLFTRDLSLDDRVALVTGGNSGIGLEVALGFLEAGARAVYCVDLPQSPSDAWLAVQRYASTLQVSSETKAGRLEYVQGDVTDQKRMWDIAAKIGDKEARLDMCLAGAGILPDPSDCLDYPADMMRKDLGTVAYNSSKGAVLQMARSMACELAPRGIRVNSLSPGYTYTPMTYKLVDDDVEYFDKVAPMGRVGRPYELRGAVVWLASDSASFCTGSK